jgi:alpha-tubulin suppressor-like RCC1 family protein
MNRLLNLKRPLVASVFVALVLTLTACGGGSGGSSGSSGSSSGSNIPTTTTGSISGLAGSVTGVSRVVANKIYSYSANTTDGSTANAIVDWGDGSTAGSIAATASTKKIWRAAGNYTATLKLNSVAGGITSTTYPVAVVDSPVSSGLEHTCAILTDNKVACWGKNNRGQLGSVTSGNSDIPIVVPGLDKVVALGAYSESTCAAKSDGTVWCWGSDPSVTTGTTLTTPTKVAGLNNIIALAGGDSQSGAKHICALDKFGRVSCWGQNTSGQLGNGTLSSHDLSLPPSAIPVEVTNLTDAVSIAASGSATCAIQRAGTVICWGYGNQGQVGLLVRDPTPTTIRISIPVAVAGVNNAVSLAMSSTQSCAVLADGSITCWGFGSTFQNIATPLGFVPTTIAGISNVASLTLGDHHACALKTDTSVACWGTWFAFSGANQIIQSTPLSVKDASGAAMLGAISVSSGADHACALKEDGNVFCWGSNTSGQLGDAATANHFVANPVLLTNIGPPVTATFSTAITTGYVHSCALKVNGDVACWGGGGYGQLGNGFTGNSSLPVTVPLPSAAVSVSAGYAHTCALLVNGDVACWGLNEDGQIGNGSNVDSLLPVVVNIGGSAASVSSGAHHTCAVKTSGAAICWGRGDLGQLGSSVFASSNIPVGVNVPGGVLSVSSGGFHTCAIKTNSTAICWGFGGDGALGNGSTNRTASPVDVSIAGNVIKISAGEFHTCAIKSGGAVACWGYGYQGQLGNSANNTSALPVSVIGISNAASISAGGTHTCALQTNSQVFCWGDGLQGQMGNGANLSTNIPTPVTLTGGVSALAAGAVGNCVLKTNGDIECWGDGTYGQNGSATGDDFNLPTKVNGIITQITPPRTFWR